MKTLGVVWTSVLVRDLDACAAFYRDLLGMPETARGPGYVLLDAGNGASFELNEAPEHLAPLGEVPLRPTWEITLAVDDLDVAIDELSSQGVRFLPKHIGRYGDGRWVRLRDPERNLISLKEERPQRVPSKAELLEKLRASETEALTQLQRVPAERFEQVVSSEGWTGQQALAAVAAVERSPSRLIDIARERRAGAPERPPRGTGSSYIRRQLALRAEAPVAGLIEEFQANRAASIAAVEQADEDLLAGMSTVPILAPLATVIYELAIEQMLGYLGEITGGDYMSWRLRRVPS